MSSLLAPLFEFITSAIASFGYPGIAVAMALESACIPLPSEVILPFGGYLVSTGSLGFWGTVLAGTIGGTIGSIVAYFVGLRGGRPFLRKYGHYVFFSEKEFVVAEKWFNRYGEATVFFTRLMPIIRTFISLPAGIAAMPFGRFVVYTFLGSLPWSILLVFVGRQLGANWEALSPIFHRFDLIIVAGLILLVFFYWRRHRSRR
ncbi:DedA family protein [Neomoorella thermoacetica]|uniref:DedA family protein n=1 Tax=Neomoorella thermoacetica TaxID=1525 RepID=UPI0009083FF1|nr:DedA family protein [Moorella thermoacetica]APC07837.1 inner membrane protein YqjA [Moorella thermoacetica]